MKANFEAFRGDDFYLSNFYPCPVRWDGEVWPSAEHAYQAAKAEFREDKMAILRMTAGQAKRYSRKMKMRADFHNNKVGIMAKIVEAKFLAHRHLRLKLYATDGQPIVEYNTWHDNFWGQCTCDRCRGKIEGQNHLGKILMKLRDSFRVGKAQS